MRRASGPSERPSDIELELGAIVGTGNPHGPAGHDRAGVGR